MPRKVEKKRRWPAANGWTQLYLEDLKDHIRDRSSWRKTIIIVAKCWNWVDESIKPEKA